MKLYKINTTTKKEMKEILNGYGFFQITFLKVDGVTIRKMNCRIVKDKKFFKGGELKGNREHLLEVIDISLVKKGLNPTSCWRSFPIANLISLKAKGLEWVK
tara:strand:+ start:267 stop:572 length:306 start_codon:yes stop_codon:yes gene_type:complete